MYNLKKKSLWKVALFGGLFDLFVKIIYYQEFFTEECVSEFNVFNGILV